MAEEKLTVIKSSLMTWVKAGLTSIVGLVSGACLMYLTPIINSTIKPAQPVANFSTQVAGLTVTFNNRSTGGTTGWWDFGDGSALEPYSPTQAIFTHTYDKPGTYNVKLALQNLLNEESDRTVSITADGSTAATKPEIELFDVTPVTKGERAPAIYCLKSKVKNAAYSIVSSGDERPLQLDAAVTNLERYFTFDEMGAYTIRLAVVSGKDIIEKTKTVYVGAGDGLEPMAKLSVSYQAVRVESALEKLFRIHCGWHGDAGSNTCCPIHAERLASPGFKFTDLTIVNKDDENVPARNLKVELAPDKSRFSFTGELVKSSSFLQPKSLPHWMALVKASMPAPLRPGGAQPRRRRHGGLAEQHRKNTDAAPGRRLGSPEHPGDARTMGRHAQGLGKQQGGHQRQDDAEKSTMLHHDDAANRRHAAENRRPSAPPATFQVTPERYAPSSRDIPASERGPLSRDVPDAAEGRGTAARDIPGAAERCRARPVPRGGQAHQFRTSAAALDQAEEKLRVRSRKHFRAATVRERVYRCAP